MKANVNDVIQVNELVQNNAWTGCLLIVREVKDWGVTASLEIPQNGTAYVRLSYDQYEVIGQAVLVPVEDVENDTKSDNV